MDTALTEMSDAKLRLENHLSGRVTWNDPAPFESAFTSPTAQVSELSIPDIADSVTKSSAAKGGGTGAKSLIMLWK